MHDTGDDEEGTYAQRVRRIFDMMDVRTAFTTEAELAAAVKARAHRVQLGQRRVPWLRSRAALWALSGERRR